MMIGLELAEKGPHKVGFAGLKIRKFLNLFQRDIPLRDWSSIAQTELTALFSSTIDAM